MSLQAVFSFNLKFLNKIIDLQNLICAFISSHRLFAVAAVLLGDSETTKWIGKYTPDSFSDCEEGPMDILELRGDPYLTIPEKR